MNVNIPINLKSAAFWSALAGAASTVMGALGYAHLGAAVSTVLVAIGGLLIAIPAHHVVSRQQGTAPSSVTVTTPPAVSPTPAASAVPGAIQQL